MRLTWLNQLDCQEVSLTGGKAANLARLAADYPVPPGFCLTTEAYQTWADVATPEQLPTPMASLLTEAYTTLATQTQEATPRVAVRSSAVGEDGGDTSFAGQYETFLNVMGDVAVHQAVVRCWTTAQAERVQVYRDQQQGSNGTAAAYPLAVLVQWLVPADSSFVAFSANPVSGERGEVVINANWGLGESVVSGLTTPDNYIVNKADYSARETTVAAKQAMTIVTDAGVKTVKVPRLLRQQAVLTADQLKGITVLATTLEEQMGWPVDIEGAFHGDKLYLLQCRPISTLTDV